MAIKLFIFFLISFIYTSCASQQELESTKQKQDILESRIIALEEGNLGSVKDLKDEQKSLRSFVRDKIQQFREAQLAFINDLEALKKEVERVSSLSEENDNLLRRIDTQLKTVKKRLGDQVIAFSELQRIFITQANEGQKIKNEKERKDYEAGLKTLQERDFEGAYSKFSDFRAKFPKSEFYDDALFYIAYVQLLRSKYESASLHFYELKEQFPDSTKRNEGLWWLGVSLEKTGDKQAAIDIYQLLLELESDNEYRQKGEIRLDEIHSPQEPAIEKK